MNTTTTTLAQFDNVQRTHYIILDSTDYVWGVGTSEAEAWNDAREWTEDNLSGLRIEDATEAVYEYIQEHGADGWDRLVLNRHPTYVSLAA